MSYWIYKKDKNGNTNILTVEVPVLILVAIFGLIISFIMPTYLNHPSKVFYITISAGFVFVLISKISLFRKGIWCSWGGRLMSRPFKMIYRAGYTLIFVGILLSLPFWRQKTSTARAKKKTLSY